MAIETLLTPSQRERAGSEVAMHALASASAKGLIDATIHVANRMEFRATSAAVWELWKSGHVEVP